MMYNVLREYDFPPYECAKIFSNPRIFSNSEIGQSQIKVKVNHHYFPSCNTNVSTAVNTCVLLNMINKTTYVDLAE